MSREKKYSYLEIEDIRRVLKRLFLDDIAGGFTDVFDDERAMKELDALPPADVVPGHCYRELKQEYEKIKGNRPAKYIQWLPVQRGMIWAYECSDCGYMDRDTFEKTYKNFCPCCGGEYRKEYCDG